MQETAAAAPDIRLIATDLDGTLIGSANEFPLYNTFRERVDQLKPFAGSVTDNVAADGSKSIALVLDVKDLAAFQAAMAAPPPELAAAMERHGVIQPLKVYVEK